MSTPYFDGLLFIGAEEVPECRAQLENFSADALALNFLLHGRIHFRAEDQPSDILEGPMIYWTLPGARYTYGNVPGSHWHQFWILVRGPRVARMLQGGLVPATETPWAVPEDADAFLADLRKLIRMVRNPRASDSARKVALFERLFLDACLPSSRHGDIGTARERVRQLAGRVAAAPAKAWDFHREAKKCGMSYHHLRRLFRMETGSGPADYLLDCRLREAAARLRRGISSVKEAAYVSGFPDAHSLARMMRRRMGITPSELRFALARPGRAIVP